MANTRTDRSKDYNIYYIAIIWQIDQGFLRLLDDIIIVTLVFFFPHTLAPRRLLRFLCKLFVRLEIIEGDYLVASCSWALCARFVGEEFPDGVRSERMSAHAPVMQL